MQILNRQASRRELFRATALGAGVVAAASITGCGADSSEPAQSQDGASRDDHRAIGRIKAAGSDSGSASVMRRALKIAAKDLGYADIELADMAQPTALLSLQKGSVTCAMLSWANFAQDKEKGIDCVAIAPAWASHASILVHADSKIEKLTDLKGCTMVSSARTTGVYQETRAVLYQNGIDIEKDLHLSPMGDSTVARALYEKGEFDALLVSEPSVSQVLAKGNSREIIQTGKYQASKNGGVFVPVNSWGIRKDWFQARDQAKIHALFKKASDIARTSREPYEMVARQTGLDGETLDLYYKRFSKLVISEFTSESIKVAQEMLDLYKKLGMFEHSVSPQDFVYKA